MRVKTQFVKGLPFEMHLPGKSKEQSNRNKVLDGIINPSLRERLDRPIVGTKGFKKLNEVMN